MAVSVGRTVTRVHYLTSQMSTHLLQTSWVQLSLVYDLDGNLRNEGGIPGKEKVVEILSRDRSYVT